MWDCKTGAVAVAVLCPKFAFGPPVVQGKQLETGQNRALDAVDQNVGVLPRVV